MEDQPAHAKRKRYDAPTYARLLADLTQAMEEVPKLRPDRDAWDIEGDWAPTGTIHFVEAIHQPLFEALREFDCRSIKLVNLDKPALRITFYKKHRYWLLKDKDLPLDQKITQVQAYIDELNHKASQLLSQPNQLILTRQAHTRQQLDSIDQQILVWQQILADPVHYQMAVSNYSRQHCYVTVNYKYRLASGDYANEQIHLLNAQRDRLGNVTQPRYNILFIDSQEILREHPYQNREVEGYLAGFPIQSQAGRHTIYARLRAETDALRSFS